MLDVDELVSIGAELVDAGCGTFPVALAWNEAKGAIDKRPTTTHGHLDATVDLAVLEQQIAGARLRDGEELGVGFSPGPAGYVALDCDVKHGRAGRDTLTRLEAVHGEFVKAAWMSPSGGLNVLCRKPPGACYSNRSPWDGVDVRADNGWLVAPGVRCSWGEWRWHTGELADAAPLPAGMAAELSAGGTYGRPVNAQVVLEFLERSPTSSSLAARTMFDGRLAELAATTSGSRHDALKSLLGWTFGMAALDLRQAMADIVDVWARLVPGEGRDAEAWDLARWVVAQELASRNGDSGPAAAVEPCSLDECIATYRRWLHLPDPDQVTAALGAVAANLLPGDPLWLLLVGSSGSGKTETIEPLDGLPYVHKAATLTEPALLSGSSKRDREKGATGGILRQVGEFGILLAKDFGSVLSMHREGRGQALAALREIADGSWARPLGTGGGRVLQWSGKCGLVGAVTPVLDRHSAVMGVLGERFVLYRLNVDDPKAQARRRLRNRGRETEMRAELTAAAAGVLAKVGTVLPDLTDADADHLVDLAVFVVWARTPVDRDGYNHEVVAMPTREAPARLAGSLGQLLAGLEAVGADPDTRWRIVDKCAWDCVPNLRSRLLHAVRRLGDSRSSALITDTGIPKTTADRTLEDLALLGLIHRDKAGSHDTAPWTHRLTDEADKAWP